MSIGPKRPGRQLQLEGARFRLKTWRAPGAIGRRKAGAFTESPEGPLSPRRKLTQASPLRQALGCGEAVMTITVQRLQRGHG